MKRILILFFCLFVLAGLSEAAEYIAYPGSDTTSDTVLVSTADTTSTIDMWGTTTRPMPGIPGFNFLFTNIDGSTHDSITVDLYVTTVAGIAKDGDGWGFVESFQLATYSRSGTGLAANEDVFLVVDTLNYISARYCHWVIDAVGGSSGDSTSYRMIFSGDKNTRKITN